MDNKQLFKKMKWNLFLLGKLKIPMLAYTGIQLLELNETDVKVIIKLKRKTKNHLNSMYFGALAVGADVAGGIHAFYYAEKMNKKISFAFKAMNAHFIKRAETDCTFISKDGKKVETAVLQSIKLQERVNETTKVFAYDINNELVAEFDMTVSIKCLD